MAMLVSLTFRTPFKTNALQDRGVMARIASCDNIEKVCQLQVMNATRNRSALQDSRHGLTVRSKDEVMVESTHARRLAVRVQAPCEPAAPGTHPAAFEINALDVAGHVSEKSVFMFHQKRNVTQAFIDRKCP